MVATVPRGYARGTTGKYAFVRLNSSVKNSNVSGFDEKLEVHLQTLHKRYDALSTEMSTGAVNDPRKLAKIGKEFAEVSVIVDLNNARIEHIATIKDLLSMEEDELSKGSEGQDMLLLAQEERQETQTQLEEIEEKLIRLLTPRDDADDRGVILEVRAGTGGDEASLFASEMFRMYQKFSSLQGWKWEQMSISRSEVGGFKDAQALISGDSVYKKLKFESGVHRVQRVPSNDVRIQTSAASVIVLPEAQEIDVQLKPQDLRIDIFRSQGAGGQSVNTTDSAVRITHIPTGCVVSMQDERSQIQNKARAMQYLLARVYDVERQKAEKERSEQRSAAHGTGDRSDKIRTYNFPQDRVTDHRVSLTIPGVERIMSGESLNEFTDALVDVDERNRLLNFMDKLKKGEALLS